ncbi:MAG: hypothetical protein E4H28_03370 [Gemmatimonadales bacterium]|nr:MAG: hypothetical protein E4H28_03370 [Gemmatimonadales bacterium]
MMIEQLRLRSAKAVMVMALALVPVACGDDATGPGNTTPSISLSVSVPASAPTAAIAQGISFDRVFVGGGSTLTLTRVAMVLRDVELEQEFGECEDLPDAIDDDCEEFETGPFLLELPMDETVQTAFEISGVPLGTYDELEFKVHKPEDANEGDTSFLTQNPDFTDVSIRVEGDFEGQAFVYETDLNAEQEAQLSPPLVVTDGASVNVTFSVDVATWFRALDGSLIDPATANKGELNEGIVEENIIASIDIFEDDDHDGEDDSLGS